MCLSVLQVLGELRWSRQAPCVSAGEPSGQPVCRAHGPCAFRWGSSVDLTSAHTLFFPVLHPRSNQVGRQDPSLSGHHVAVVTSHLNGPLGICHTSSQMLGSSRAMNPWGPSWVECYSPKCAEILSLAPWDSALIWEWGLCRGHPAKRGYSRLGWALVHDSCGPTEGEFDADPQEMAREGRGEMGVRCLQAEDSFPPGAGGKWVRGLLQAFRGAGP